jgi:hypothetical protein
MQSITKAIPATFWTFLWLVWGIRIRIATVNITFFLHQQKELYLRHLKETLARCWVGGTRIFWKVRTVIHHRTSFGFDLDVFSDYSISRSGSKELKHMLWTPEKWPKRTVLDVFLRFILSISSIQVWSFQAGEPALWAPGTLRLKGVYFSHCDEQWNQLFGTKRTSKPRKWNTGIQTQAPSRKPLATASVTDSSELIMLRKLWFNKRRVVRTEF